MKKKTHRKIHNDYVSTRENSLYLAKTQKKAHPEGYACHTDGLPPPT